MRFSRKQEKSQLEQLEKDRAAVREAIRQAVARAVYESCLKSGLL